MADDDDDEDIDLGAGTSDYADASPGGNPYAKYAGAAQAQQPDVNPYAKYVSGQQQPEPDVNPYAKYVGGQQQQQQPEAESPFWTTLRQAAHGALPMLAGAASGVATGAGYGAAAGTLGLPGPGTLAGTIIGGGLGLVTGAAGGYAASTAQEAGAKALGFDDSQQLAANAAANPWSSAIGAAAPAAIPFGVGGKAVGLGARALYGAVAGGAEAGSEYAGGQDLDPRAIGLSALTGGALAQPRGFLAPAEAAGARLGTRLAEQFHGTPGSKGAAGTAEAQPRPAGGPPGEGGAAAATPEATTPAGDRGGPEDYGKAVEPSAGPPAAEQSITNTDPALDAAIRAKMEPEGTSPEGEAAAPPPEPLPGPAGAAEPEIPTATSAKLEAQFPRVANQQARPLTEAAATLYHGTNQQFADFDPAQLQRSSGSYDAAHGFYFTDDPEVASFFADSPKNGRIIEARLDFKNPKTIKLDPSDNTLDKNASIKEAFAAGHDAVIFKGSSEGKGPVTTTYVVPRTDQINQIASYPTTEALQRARTPREAIAQRAPDETVTSEPSTDPLQQRVNAAAAAPNPAAHLRETAAMYREQGQEGTARRLEQGADAIERSQQQQQQQQQQRQQPAAAGGGPPKPPTVGQAAAAGGTALPPGPTSMAYAPPQNRSNLSKLWRSMKLLVGSDIGPYGRQAENIIRGAYGRAKRVFEQTMNLLNPHMETVRNMGPMDRAALNNRIEGGNDFPNWQPTPDQQRIIDVHKPAMDLWKDQFSKLDRTAQMKFVNDYLAHMYKNPAQASEFFSQFGKRGGAGSTKGRTHATYEDAKRAGLEPLTDNPIEIATRYGLSMTNFLASNDALERGVETGVVGYFNSGKSVGATGSPEPHQVGGPPPGWKKLNAPPKGPFLEAYAPEDFADKYNAFYSQGLRGAHAPIYDALRSANAGWTMMELGLNAYHFFTMGNEAIISDVKRGLDQIFTGQIKEGAKTIAGAPLAPGTRYIEGKRFQREYLDPNSTNPIASIMAEANARPVGRGHAYDILGSTGDENISRGSFIKNFDKDKINSQLKQAWDDVKDDWGLADSVGKQAMFPFKQASRVLQTVGAPLFDKYIPALKAGAMHSQMADWLAANPHVDINTPAGRQAAVEMAMKISDSVDNAYGEMVHDNLFMNQALRHAAMVAMRSFSWSIGAMRQIGGGTYAAGKAAALSLKTGENRFSMAHPEFDPRISYAIAFPFVVATISAIYQGLRAGEAPQDWRDLYAPRTGGTVPGLGGKGQVPEHALMPGFQKDVYGWLSHPLREGYAKLGGLPTTAIEHITNRDWRGDPIAQRGASPLDQFQQHMAHLFSKLGPIGARAIAKGQPETSGITPVETALGFRAPGVDIQDPTRLEKWMAASAKKEWKAKERHDKTEQRKYARERTYDPQEREQQPQ